jgi:large subunit ribosomal protein L1
MKQGSKRYRADAKKVDAKKSYSIDDALKALKTMGTTKFNQTVTVALKLNIDAKKSDQGIRGSVALPHGIGKKKVVVVFADGDEARVAKESGASEIGMDELAQKIQGGWDAFDVCISVQRAMKVVSRLGKVLGPKGKMPNPKNGTVVGDGKLEEMKNAVREFAAGRVEFRNDNDGNLHAPVGKISFAEKELKENILAFVDHIKGMRPTSVKGHFIEGVCVTGAMSPGMRLDLSPL